MKQNCQTIAEIVNFLKRDQLAALPTETVYGLSCRLREEAIIRLLALKNRDASKGFIIVCASVSQCLKYVNQTKLESKHLQQLKYLPERPTTWILPASEKLSHILTGGRETVAIRITQHPLLKNICEQLDEAIISTSANLSGKPEARSSTEVLNYFPSGLDYVWEGEVARDSQPSRIIELISGKVIRE